ncbi:Purine permease plant protein [Dioscorea alata]|uniref:Purine permease plant protein n=1 Tax=Dioscorea alata TaxID=55571 RepID=A0ACB7UFX2_DIOAL|nr:Purine permease plant protein [Dioscorea alata]
MDANQLIQPLNNTSSSLQSTPSMTRDMQWLFKVSIYTFLLVAGLVAGTLLNRFYYDQGGNSMWLQTLTYCAGFPILCIPLLLSNQSTSISAAKPLPIAKLAVIYAVFGIMAALANLMYSYGLLYLSVSTYSLLSATQLGFNAIFSYFINSEKFTYLTFNSIVLLTFSATIIGFQNDSDDYSETFGGKYLLGFILTLAAAANCSLILSLMQLSFDKFIKRRELSVILKLQIYTAGASTAAATVGLFASGEWRDLKGDMDGFKKGRLSYVITLVMTAICWQVNVVSVVALVYEVSSLFSNVIYSLGTPIVPLFAVFLFHDDMNGIKVMSLFMALWGFSSYFYQHYLEYKLEKRERIGVGEPMVA